MADQIMNLLRGDLQNAVSVLVPILVIEIGLCCFLLLSPKGTRFWKPYLLLFPLGTLLSVPQGISALVGCLLISAGTSICFRSKFGSFEAVAALILVTLPLSIWSGGAGTGSGWASWFEQFGLTLDQADQLVFWVRKFVHFTYFGLMAAAAYRSIPASEHWKAERAAISWAAAHAVFDETRQSFLSSRTGKIEDVLLDLSGAVCFILVVRKIRK